MHARPALAAVAALLTTFLAGLAQAEDKAWQFQFAAVHAGDVYHGGKRAGATFSSPWIEPPRPYSDVLQATALARLPYGDRVAVRLDAGYLDRGGTSGFGARSFLEYRHPWWAGGIGMRMVRKDFDVDHDLPNVPAWLRLGPETVHLRVRYLEGGPLATIDDVGGIGVQSELELFGPGEYLLAVSWVASTLGAGPEVTFGWQLAPLRILAQFRRVTPSSGLDEASEHTQVGIAVSGAFGVPQTHYIDPPQPPPPYGPAPPPALVPAKPDPSWPVVADVLVPGRIFSLRHGPLRVMDGATVPVMQDTICAVDEQVAAGGHTWSHVTCAPELPTGSPPAWRTGCYVTTTGGIWRLAHCPGEQATSGQGARLLVPSEPPSAWSGFVSIGERPAEARMTKLGDADVRAVCVAYDLDGVHEQCFAGHHGLIWSSWRWLHRMNRRAETAVRLVSVTSGGPVDAAAPHLRFVRPESARCEAAPACTVFGQCRVTEQGCVAASDDDCQRAAACARWGHCTARYGRCAARSDADCRGSEACRQSGQCSFGDGRCLALAEDCVASVECREAARCTPVAGRCRLTGDADCARAAACGLEGACSLVDGACQARADGDCLATEACVVEKRCRAEAGRCVAAALVPKASTEP